MTTTETEEAETGPGAPVPDPVVPPDEKELLLQRRLARIEEALGLSPSHLKRTSAENRKSTWNSK